MAFCCKVTSPGWVLLAGAAGWEPLAWAGAGGVHLLLQLLHHVLVERGLRQALRQGTSVVLGCQPFYELFVAVVARLVVATVQVRPETLVRQRRLLVGGGGDVLELGRPCLVVAPEGTHIFPPRVMPFASGVLPMLFLRLYPQTTWLSNHLVGLGSPTTWLDVALQPLGWSLKPGAAHTCFYTILGLSNPMLPILWAFQPTHYQKTLATQTVGFPTLTTQTVGFPTLTAETVGFPTLTTQAVGFPTLTTQAMGFPTLTTSSSGLSNPNKPIFHTHIAFSLQQLLFQGQAILQAASFLQLLQQLLSQILGLFQGGGFHL